MGYNVVYESFSLNSDSCITVQHPAVRRMTALQKCALETCQRLELRTAGILSRLLREDDLLVYFAIPFGEMDAMLANDRSLFINDSKPSPGAFQHSVYNTVSGYFSILYQSAHPSITISDGYLSFDKAIHLAYAKLRAGLCRIVILLHASEKVVMTPGALAEAELLILAQPGVIDSSQRKYQLVDVAYGSAPDRLDIAALDLQEVGGAARTLPLLRLGSESQTFVRKARACEGETLTSCWRYCP